MITFRRPGLFTMAIEAGLPIAGRVPTSPPDAWARVRANLPVTQQSTSPRSSCLASADPVLEARTDAEYGPRYTVEYSAADEHLFFSLRIRHCAFGNAAPPDGPTADEHSRIGRHPVQHATGSPAHSAAWQKQARSYQVNVYSQRATAMIWCRLQPVSHPCTSPARPCRARLNAQTQHYSSASATRLATRSSPR
jgi:hypothetical protein